MYFRLAEWHPAKTIWFAWPYDETLWGENLFSAQKEFIALIDALKNEQVVVLFPDQKALQKASSKFGQVLENVSKKVVRYGDIWLRDTLPIFVKNDQGHTVAFIPKFNGWGNKYFFADDRDLSVRVADLLLMKKIFSSIVFEGGAIEFDGAGTLLTTEQCLLNPNRNPNVSKKTIEQEFKKYFGATKIIWLKEGLKNDHTDGHIDTIARFIGPQKIAIMKGKSNDPNYQVLCDVKERLKNETDAHANPFHIVEVPSPGAVYDENNQLMPASYLNFIMGDSTLLVPTFNSLMDQEAVTVFKKHSNLEVVGLSAKSILTGGGAFHCICQEYFR